MPAPAVGDGFIAVTPSPDQLAELQRVLRDVPKGVPRALTGAINRTGTTGRSRIVRRLAKILNLPTATIRSFITWGKANYDTLSGTIRISRKGIALIKFPGVSPSVPGSALGVAGVRVKVLKSGPARLFAGTFIAKMKSGHIGVFERLGRSGKRVRRLPIIERYGPTPLGVFTNAPGVAQEEVGALGPILEKNLASKVDWLLSKATPPPDDDRGGGDDDRDE